MINKQQFRKLKALIAGGTTLKQAALQVGISDKTSRKYNRVETYPVNIDPRQYSTREDPLLKIWSLAIEKLSNDSRLDAKALFLYLHKEHPTDLPKNALRTFQRRVKTWRANNGVSKEVFFPQVHIPGELSESDFTHMEELKITINGKPYPHMLYHLVLTYSNWEFVKICFSETFENLLDGFQKAMQDLGGVPKYHQTDQLTAAVTQYPSKEEFTKSYTDAMAHYKVIPLKIQVRKPNENGDIEKSHHVLKHALDQNLLLRGSRDFQTEVEYEKYLKDFIRDQNAPRHKQYLEEKEKLMPLPVNPIGYIKKYKIKLSNFSTLNISKNTYSLPSCYIGLYLCCCVDVDEIKVYFDNRLIATLPRLKGSGNATIRYQDIIEWLVKKPGAFKKYKYFDFLFPSTNFRFAYDYLVKSDHLNATKQYLNILNLASKNESKVESILKMYLQSGENFDFKTIADAVDSPKEEKIFLDIKIPSIDLNNYDKLLQGSNICQLQN